MFGSSEAATQLHANASGGKEALDDSIYSCLTSVYAYVARLPNEQPSTPFPHQTCNAIRFRTPRYTREFRSRFHSMCIREFTRTARTSRMVFLHAIYFYEHRVAHSVNCICSLAQYIYLYARRFSLRGENCKIFVHQLWPRALSAEFAPTVVCACFRYI